MHQNLLVVFAVANVCFFSLREVGACAIQGYDSGECKDPEEFELEMPFCKDIVNYRACVPRYQGGSVSRWGNHSVRTKDRWVEESFFREFNLRKQIETNETLQDFGIDENGEEGAPVMRFYPSGHEDANNFINDCAQAYMNLFCWANFPRCDPEEKSLILCTSVCENYFKSCGYPKDMWRCGDSELINAERVEAPLLFKEGFEIDVQGFDPLGNQYFLRSFFPGQPFRQNRFEADGQTPIVICTPSIKNGAQDTIKRAANVFIMLMLLLFVCI